jgi:hypothetical protein
MTRLEFLKSQLADIERLDCFYWQTEDPNRYETLGYLSRKNRRRELITELLMLLDSGSQIRVVVFRPACVCSSNWRDPFDTVHTVLLVPHICVM